MCSQCASTGCARQCDLNRVRALQVFWKNLCSSVPGRNLTWSKQCVEEVFGKSLFFLKLNFLFDPGIFTKVFRDRVYFDGGISSFIFVLTRLRKRKCTEEEYVKTRVKYFLVNSECQSSLKSDVMNWKEELKKITMANFILSRARRLFSYTDLDGKIFFTASNYHDSWKMFCCCCWFSLVNTH